MNSYLIKKNKKGLIYLTHPFANVSVAFDLLKVKFIDCLIELGNTKISHKRTDTATANLLVGRSNISADKVHIPSLQSLLNRIIMCRFQVSRMNKRSNLRKPEDES